MAFYAEKITDNFAYWPGYEYDDDRTVRFRFCDVHHPDDTPETNEGGFFALSDDAFLLLINAYGKSPGEVKVVDSGGRITFRHELPKHDTPQYGPVFWATSDERGDRFAFVVDTWRGGSRFFDVSGKVVVRRVAVYSETGGELASIAVSTAYHRDFDFALSPDGHRLAVLENGTLTIAELK